MQLWEEFLSTLEDKWGKDPVAEWIRPLKVASFDAANIFLEAGEPFQVSYFEEHVRPLLTKNPLRNNNNRPVRVHLALPPSKAASKYLAPSPTLRIEPDPLDPELTLKNFLSTPQNAIALNLLSEIPKLPFNPIYIYGPPLSGKTHLLMAAAELFQKCGKKVLYVRAETFTGQLVSALRGGGMQQFRKAYRSADALLIDGIHIFSRKSATQEEFFHTFNDLHTRGCPILISSQSSPSKLTEIEDRLVSRFEWGITIGIDPISTPILLEKKAALWKLSLSPDVLSFLSSSFPTTPLLALQALSLRAKGTHTLTVPLVIKLLADLLEKQAQNALTSEQIVKAIAAHYGIRSEDLLGKSQTREASLPRSVAMYLCRERLKLPFQKIGSLFGRDHSTVMSSVKQIQKGLEEKKPELLEAMNAVKG